MFILTLHNIKTLHHNDSVLRLKERRETLMKDYLLYCENSIEVSPFFNHRTDEYIICSKIPSESNAKYTKPFFYETVLCFTPLNKQSVGDNTLSSYKITVFSNMASFIFSYTYVFKQERCLIKWFPNKYWSMAALKYRPVQRNRFELILYEKSIYFTYLFMLLHNFHRKDILGDYITKIRNNTDIFKHFHITSQNDKMIERKVWDKNYKEKKEDNVKRKKQKIKFFENSKPFRDKMLYLKGFA